MSATNPNVPQSQVKDRQLHRAVEEMLARDANVNAQDINIQARNGIVVLTGTVGTLHEKEIAESLAKKVEGASFVENALVISAEEYIQDGDIRSKVEEVLGDFPDYDPASVGVRLVEDGLVYITGSVISASEKKQAEEMVAGVPGVREVINEIVIAPGEPMSDIDINNLVIDAISDDPRIDQFDIEVEVKNGDVSITGTVQDAAAKEAVTERAMETPGVKAVFNGLEVREG